MSTDSRWLGIKDLEFKIDGDTITVTDGIASDIGRGSQSIGSSSETDDFANHFIQGVEIADSFSFSTYDLTGARALAQKRGKTGTISLTIPQAAESTLTVDYIVENATCGLAMVQNVSFSIGRNEQLVAQVAMIFKSNGSTPGLRLRAA